MKRLRSIVVTTLLVILIIWLGLTVWVEMKGPAKTWELGNSSGKKVLIIYDPDPIYNLDEQVCTVLGKVLADRGYSVRISSVAAATGHQSYDLYVFCANTYNWRPDWAVIGFIKKESTIENKLVVAITVGSGATNQSQRALEEIISEKKGSLIASHAFWLMRPNDRSRMAESNLKVALSQVEAWGKEIDAPLP